jgi:L-2-hydroxyglutarate oxidase LhgO
LIIGAGISGLSTAVNYKNLKPKHQVTIIDAVNHLSSPLQASSVNCGIIESGTAMDDPLTREVLDSSFNFYSKLGKKISCKQNQLFTMCMTDDEVLWAKKQVKFGRDKGIKEKDLRFMENEEIKIHEPNVGPDVKGAIF